MHELGAKSKTVAAFAASRQRLAWLGLGLTGLVAGLFILSLGVGHAALPWGDLLAHRGQMDLSGPLMILREIRLPRAILAVLVGAGLGLSGAVLQGFLRNPLADPALIGASSTAALGAVLVFYSGLSAAWPPALPLGGLLGAGLAVVLIYALAGRDASALTLILAGVAVNSLAGAMTALALNFAPSPYAALEIVFWLLGSLANRSMEHVWLITPFVVVGCAMLASTGPALDALALGEDAARSMGVRLRRVRLMAIGGTALAVGAGVAVVGSVGFVGLMVPHLLRPFVGHRPSALLGLSALGGAALVLGADILVRLLSGGIEIKLGVVTAVLGGPFFLYLLMYTRRTMR